VKALNLVSVFSAFPSFSDTFKKCLYLFYWLKKCFCPKVWV